MTALNAIIQQHLKNNHRAIEVLEDATDLAEACQRLNTYYRADNPLVSDEIYDHVFLYALREESPDHPFLHHVEPEPLNPNLPIIRHETPLLSTLKAYSQQQVASYVNKVVRAAKKLGFNEPLMFRLSAKLDGVSAYDTGVTLGTRGDDGIQGNDITRIISQGVTTIGGRGHGRGEVVISKPIFEKHLGKGTAHDMDDPRTFITGFIGADTIKPHHAVALEQGAIRFVPFSLLPDRYVPAEVLLNEWSALYDELLEGHEYLTDGIVVEAPASVREFMGATYDHERGVLAIKKRGEVATTGVTSIRVTTGRTGRITPTLFLDPVYLSNANISKAVAHTTKKLIDLGLGVGAQVTVTRAGSVIPAIVGVVTPAATPLVVTHCPVCETEAEQDGEYLVCPNTSGCSAQTEARLRHWFHTLANVNGFGAKTIETLVDAGYTDIRTLYGCTATDFFKLGIGPGVSQNLVSELVRSRTEELQEWRFLAAFGIRHLGKGAARNLLASFPLHDVGTLTASEIESLSGFGPERASAISKGLQEQWSLITAMMELGFNLKAEAPIADATVASSDLPLAGESIVFTGTMQQANRKDMEANAAAIGAQVQDSISAKTTTMLVYGEKAGGKLTKARAVNEKAGNQVINILTEAEYAAYLTKAGNNVS